MRSSDVFVFLDDVPFSKNSVENRNLIKTPRGKLWLTVPVRTVGRYGQLIRDVEIDNSQNWAEKHWKSLSMNYRKARFYSTHAPFFETLYSKDWSKLMHLSIEITDYMAGSFGIANKTLLSSSLGVEGTGTQRLVNICKKLGADTYLSGTGAKAYQDDSLFHEAKIRVVYQQFVVEPYPQLYGRFIPNLSGVDYLMNCDSRAVFAR
jgi:hypothetical protein